MQTLFQTLMGTMGAVGFSVLFNVKGKKIAASALGAALSWTVYMAVFHVYEDKVICVLGATVTAAILSEILARVMKAPVITLLVPMLIPLIPGSDLYYTTTNLVQGNTVEFAEHLSLVMRESGAIAFGIILVTCMVQVILKIYRHFSMPRVPRKS